MTRAILMVETWGAEWDPCAETLNPGNLSCTAPKLPGRTCLSLSFSRGRERLPKAESLAPGLAQGIPLRSRWILALQGIQGSHWGLNKAGVVVELERGGGKPQPERVRVA